MTNFILTQEIQEKKHKKGVWKNFIFLNKIFQTPQYFFRTTINPEM